MRNLTRIVISALLCVSASVSISGCAALKKKFTPKQKEQKPQQVFHQVRTYDIKPSLELYEKHYVFWINWHRKLVDELGESHKSDVRSTQEMIGNLKDMAAMLVDEKSDQLMPHITELKEAKDIIDKRDMTKVNEVRIRRIVEREYRVIKREFSPNKMAEYIRNDWK